MTNNIDLDKPLVGHEYKLKVEPKETGADRNVRLFKDLALFLAALSFVAIIIYMCVVTLISSTSTQDEKKMGHVYRHWRNWRAHWVSD